MLNNVLLPFLVTCLYFYSHEIMRFRILTCILNLHIKSNQINIFLFFISYTIKIIK